jgi:hypothetical protein
MIQQQQQLMMDMEEYGDEDAYYDEMDLVDSQG